SCPRRGRGRGRHVVAPQARARAGLRRRRARLSGAAVHLRRRPGSMTIPAARLGASGIVVSRLGLGLAAVGRPGYINLGRARDLPERSPDALYARAAELLDIARSRGVRYVDVARSYGRAEEFLARWLRAVPRDALAVG